MAKVGDFSIRVLCTPPEPKYRPITHVDAQFSLPYTAAVAICKNRTGPEEVKEKALKDPEVLKLASKVTWELDPKAEALYPKAYPAKLVATMNDGRLFEAHVDFPKGDPEDPASFEEIVDKFNMLTEKFFNKQRRGKIVEMIKKIEKIENVAKLGDLLRG